MVDGKEQEVKPIDVSIESELNDDPNEKGKKIVVKSLLKFPCKSENHAALRVYDSNGLQHFYASPRVGNMQAQKEGFVVDITGHEKKLNGCAYVITEGKTKKVLMTGKIKSKDAAAGKVVSIGTGTNG